MRFRPEDAGRLSAAIYTTLSALAAESEGDKAWCL